MSQYPKYGNNHPYRKKNIGNIVQDAIKGVSYSRNLEELRNNIDITIREVSDLAKSGNPADVQPQEPPKAYTSPRANSSKAPVYERPESPRFNPPSKGLYTFLLILGCFFSCIFAIVCILSLLASFFYTSLLAPLAVVCGVLMLFSLALAIFAGNRNGKILRFRRYRKFIGDAEFCSLEQMAASCMEKTSKTKNAVQKMIAAGWFPNGHIDNEGTTLMLTEETYRMYLLAEDAKLQRQAEEEAKRKEEASPASTGNAELDQAVREGRAYIREIRRVNDAIPGEEISRKISQLEEITVRIFACVEKRPEKLPDIRRFMSYYLPTTLKLLNAYQEFDSQPIQSQKILSAKNEISQTLDTINNAFSSLMDTLYEEDILDIASDISVLETMFAQEGLTSSKDFHTQGSQKKNSP